MISKIVELAEQLKTLEQNIDRMSEMLTEANTQLEEVLGEEAKKKKKAAPKKAAPKKAAPKKAAPKKEEPPAEEEPKKAAPKKAASKKEEPPTEEEADVFPVEILRKNLRELASLGAGGRAAAINVLASRDVKKVDAADPSEWESMNEEVIAAIGEQG